MEQQWIFSFWAIAGRFTADGRFRSNISRTHSGVEFSGLCLRRKVSIVNVLGNSFGGIQREDTIKSQKSAQTNQEPRRRMLTDHEPISPQDRKVHKGNEEEAGETPALRPDSSQVFNFFTASRPRVLERPGAGLDFSGGHGGTELRIMLYLY